MLRFVFILTCLSFGNAARCDVPLHFQFTFGPNPDRAKNMKAETLFDSQLQIDLAKASVKGDTNQMRALISRGADVNCQGNKGMKPLFWAIINRNIKGVRFLLENGADPNAVVAIAPENALSLAASLDESGFLQELLVHKANPNATFSRSHETAIFTAAFYDKTNNILMLLKNGADIDAKNSAGYTPLHESINSTRFATALFLYRAGADPSIKNDLGNSAIDTIKKYGGGGFTPADRKGFSHLVTELKQNGVIDERTEKTLLER